MSKNQESKKGPGSGGPRPGSGRKTDIPARLVEVDCAIGPCVGLSHIRRMLREVTPEFLIGSERVRDLREWGSSKDGPKYLEVHTASYLKMRERWGFKK